MKNILMAVVITAVMFCSLSIAMADNDVFLI